MAFSDDKTCIVGKINAYNCNYQPYADQVLQAYSDLPLLLVSYKNEFDCNKSFLLQLLACVADATLVANDIYNNKTEALLTNALVIVDGTIDELLLDSVTPIEEVLIIGGTVKLLRITNGTSVGSITVGAGATVNLLKTEGVGELNYLRITACNGNAGTVKLILNGSEVMNLKIDDGATYGGYGCEPVGACGDPITALASADITSKSIKVTWTIPANSIKIQLRYRKSSSMSWIVVTGEEPESFGNFINGMQGYIFLQLEKDTYYDFSVINYCNNGQASADTNLKVKTLGDYAPSL